MTLEQLVERYCNLKAEMDSYKSQVDSDNKEIKKIMKETGRSVCTVGEYTAKYSVSVSEDFDEGKLLDKLDELDGVDLGIIKMKPYVDMEALENAIYNGYINAAELAGCKTHKETARLTISKKKEK